MPTPTRDPDRLLPVEPHTRAIAQALYFSVATAPIISPHGHVPAQWLHTDAPFSDPANLFITHDHYVTRLLHANGVPLDALGLGRQRVDPREVWRTLARHWHKFAGTASAYWITESLSGVFGVGSEMSPATADSIYDTVASALTTPEMRPRALFERFGIEVLATTDDPLDPLNAHAALATDATFTGRVIPTFRPDVYLDPESAGFAGRVEKLLAATREPSATFGAYLDALRARREHFVEHGAVSADHGVYEPYTCELDRQTADDLFQRALAGTLDANGAREFRGHMLWQMASMSVDDGLVMTIHPGVRRNHHTATSNAFGPDTGHDIPVRVEFTENLRPLLQSFGTEKEFHLVLFTIDESTYSRELAPLAGFYPSVFAGAPWWFIDAPDAISRFRSAVTESAGFYRTSGFIDDTRAYLSIPARHDVARRADASYLARLVAEGRVSMSTAERIMADTVDAIPREVFKL
ncbi:glucuronate isomerase [Demequina sp. NBRC 110056]|uniref:glucuronate isomerase n=1 Tax=Demequina sp. NBRC 110056 TaxID=1570345 RepID=UPI000A05E5AE|nr:glucuronate isomerase [Demequina sp. NBRC 110056]